VAQFILLILLRILPILLRILPILPSSILPPIDALLEYDTFFRPKYNPSQNLWPLLEKMVLADCASRVALATDLAESAMYHAIGGGPGLQALPTLIKNQLSAHGFPGLAIRQMLGENIARRLAGLS